MNNSQQRTSILFKIMSWHAKTRFKMHISFFVIISQRKENEYLYWRTLASETTSSNKRLFLLQLKSFIWFQCQFQVATHFDSRIMSPPSSISNYGTWVYYITSLCVLLQLYTVALWYRIRKPKSNWKKKKKMCNWVLLLEKWF